MANAKQEIAKVIAKAWSDEAFKSQLLSDPMQALKSGGFDVPAGLTVEVHENTDSVVHLTLPARPAGAMDLDSLDKVAGGSSYPDCMNF